MSNIVILAIQFTLFEQLAKIGSIASSNLSCEISYEMLFKTIRREIYNPKLMTQSGHPRLSAESRWPQGRNHVLLSTIAFIAPVARQNCYRIMLDGAEGIGDRFGT